MKILWQDEALLVVDKPAGLPTLPDGWDTSAPYLKGLLESQVGRVWIVHRLDRETSGVIILARSAEAHRELNRQFEQRLVQKIYHALVGAPAWEERPVDLPLRTNAGRRHRTVVDHRAGKQALTRLRLLERWQKAGLVEAIPATGRTHQIRVHLAAIGHPILGNWLYGGFEMHRGNWIREGLPSYPTDSTARRVYNLKHPHQERTYPSKWSIHKISRIHLASKA